MSLNRYHVMNTLSLATAKREQPRSRALLVYSYYRFFIALSLFGVFIGADTALALDKTSLQLYLYLLYLLFCLVSILSIYLRFSPHPTRHAFVQCCSDIVMLSLLMHTSSPSNLPVLMVVTVAASNILLSGPQAFFIAALAALCILFEQFYYALNATSFKGLEFFQSGILGITFFATALITQQLAKRLQESETLAQQRSADLVELEQLNHLIIQRMRTGILVVDEQQHIQVLNDAARHFLGLTGQQNDNNSALLTGRLQEELQRWQQNQDYRSPAFKISDQTVSILCSFTHLHADEQHARVLIFIEDHSQLSQQAQQIKLASLGTLTAAIAHEIRNPLGAISHAAQLLQESSSLHAADARLCAIIQRHSLRMNAIIENVLQLSRRQASHPERLDLNSFVPLFITEFKQSYDSAVQVLFEPHAGPLLTQVDPGQLSQVLTNLCQNGLFYSQTHSGTAQIRLRCGKLSHNDRPYIDVIDDGPGIKPADAEHIFEPFFTTRATGTGLGLYLAKELCEANESSLNYIPLAHAGACFRITFAHPERISIRPPPPNRPSDSA